MDTYCLVLIAGLCFGGQDVKAEVQTSPFGYGASVTGLNYVVHTGATDVIDSRDFRKSPKACQDDVCIRYHKHCVQSEDKITCSYMVSWPGMFPAGVFSVEARSDDALRLAESENAVMVHRDGKDAKLPIALLSVRADTEAPPACTGGDFKVCAEP